jgi:hypothetical protein
MARQNQKKTLYKPVMNAHRALARLRMRSNCGSLDFFASLFVLRQKVEKNLKQVIKEE